MTNLTRLAVALAAMLPVAAMPADAQTPASNAKWQVDVHAGGSMSAGGTGGTAIAEFPLGALLPGGPATTRAVSSWYFGDGTQLFNQTNGALGGTGRITSLDSVLRSAIANRNNGAAFGVRISRSLTTRFAAEFTFDYAPASVRMTDEAEDAIQASSASFGPAWTSLLSTGATANRTASSSAAIDRGDGHEMTLGAALKIRLPGTARLLPYITAGAGVVRTSGTLPSATLTGNYGFRFGGVFPMNEQDVVTSRAESKETTPVGLAGGGLEYNIAARHGIRGDVRVRIGGGAVDTLVSASPSVMTQTPAFVINTGTTPSVQFNNNPVTGRQSSLSGPAISDMRTFEGSGTRIVTTVSIGYFVRF